MNNIDQAWELVKEAKQFNYFGPTNIRGTKFAKDLHEKYSNWEEDKSIIFTPEELKLLKPVIARDMVSDELISYGCQPDDSDLDFKENTKSRVIQSLNIANILAKCGSFNYEIVHVVVFLALQKKLSIPLELIKILWGTR